MEGSREEIIKKFIGSYMRKGFLIYEEMRKFIT
jgi:hypothetical protein